MRKKIEWIYSCFLSLEKNHAVSGFESPVFLELLKALQSLEGQEDVEILKIFSIHLHLNKEMSLREFMYWIVPIERYLNKSLKDNDFVIFNRDVLDSQKKSKPLPLIVILDNIRSSFNVGSIFRTAEAFNIERIILTGYSPDPSNPKTQKTTLGSHQHIEWDSHPKCLNLISELKKQNIHVIAAETTNHAKNLSASFDFEKKSAIVFGNERFGLDPQVIQACDETRKISLQGFKNSLNVANCVSIFTYEFSRQYQLALEEGTFRDP
ncbi:MAG: hypothetical protein JNM39_11995 [Bdellovibrionaceae bacterium]|nr:hypothetical protein [Pseudobdellovibrionaceae bacterium]